MLDKQSQKGGDGSTNIQAETITLNLGIDEKRAREICHEMNEQLKKEYSVEALEIARSRISEFEDRLMQKVDSVEGALGAFADPGFQLLLLEAQKKAAATERRSDYDLLSELLIHRFQKGGDRPARAGITRAVDIVDEVSDEALLGLSMLHAIAYYVPSNGDIHLGLDALDRLFGKINYGDLPEGSEWLDHLDILDAVRLNSLGGLKKIQQYYAEVMDGYIDVGIEKGSSNHSKALAILRENNLPADLVVDHALNDKYVRLFVVSRKNIKDVKVRRGIVDFGAGSLSSISISESEICALESIYDLYEVDQNVRLENVRLLMLEVNKRESLRMACEWWDRIPLSVQVTQVGRVLADCNIRRFEGGIPPLK